MSDTFNLDNYVTVNERLVEFWKKHPTGRISTQIEYLDGPEHKNRMVVIKAELFAADEQIPFATGYAKEREGLGFTNRTAFIETCETSAIGRALANSGMITDKSVPRPSREEMERVRDIDLGHEDALKRIKAIATAAGAGLKKRVKEQWDVIKQDPVAAQELLDILESEIANVPDE